MIPVVCLSHGCLCPVSVYFSQHQFFGSGLKLPNWETSGKMWCTYIVALVTNARSLSSKLFFKPGIDWGKHFLLFRTNILRIVYDDGNNKTSTFMWFLTTWRSTWPWLYRFQHDKQTPIAKINTVPKSAPLKLCYSLESTPAFVRDRS